MRRVARRIHALTILVVLVVPLAARPAPPLDRGALLAEYDAIRARQKGQAVRATDAALKAVVPARFGAYRLEHSSARDGRASALFVGAGGAKVNASVTDGLGDTVYIDSEFGGQAGQSSDVVKEVIRPLPDSIGFRSARVASKGGTIRLWIRGRYYVTIRTDDKVAAVADADALLAAMKPALERLAAGSR